MHAIAYVSTAAWPLGDEELEALVDTARRHNRHSGVTGAMLYCDGNFMQYLEGDEDAMRETYARIRASVSHREITELMNQPILEREFGDWPMGFSRLSTLDFLEVASARWKGSAQTGPGAQTLRAFWREERSRRLVRA